MNIPYSIKRKAADTGALGHHEKLERIMECAEIEALISSLKVTKHHGYNERIIEIVQAWIDRTLERHRDRGDL